MNILSRLTDLPEHHENRAEDFDRRYQHTYMIHTGTPIPRPVLYLGREGSSLHFQFTDGSSHIINGNQDDNSIQPFLPQVGYYNKLGNPFYLYKNPSRQWKRSFCNGIYAVMGTRLEPRNIWGTYAECILKQEYAHLDEITNPLFTNIALNRKYAIQPKTSGAAVLLYKQYEIGTLDFSRKEVCLLQPALRQELQDLFKHSGVTKWNLKLTPAA